MWVVVAKKKCSMHVCTRGCLVRIRLKYKLECVQAKSSISLVIAQ